MMKKKKGLFFIIILLTFSFQFIVNGATDEGYGEDETCLGQFVDSFENYNNISVYEDVIVNTTLDCVELNYSAGMLEEYENFTKYTEHDTGGDITINVEEIEWDSMRRDAEDYVYYDFGIDFWDDFLFEWELNFTDVEAGDASNQAFIAICTITTDYGTRGEMITKDADTIYILMTQSGAVDDKFRLYLRQRDADTDVYLINQLSVTVLNTGIYYIRLWKSGATVNVTVFSDQAMSVVEDSLEGDGEDESYRYFQPVASIEAVADPADHSSGSVDNWWLGNYTGAYETEGYFTTDDYMNDTCCNGTTLALMINSSIPCGDIQVQFSNDNATWGDWEGTPLDSNILSGGFESIDLRYLNYTDLYLRFNFTSDLANTPRLYQARLISTIGNSTGGGAAPGPGGSGAIGFIMLILICSPLIILLWGKRK